MPSIPSIGCVIITHNALKHLPKCLPPLLNSALKPRVLVVNSSSADGTVECAQAMGAETLVIPRQEFNHGTTRERARKHLDTDIIVMLTPDAYLQDSKALEKLVAPLLEDRASIAYGRQIAHTGADFFESFAREYNYPSTSHVRSIEDASQYGAYTFFCSDSFAAYQNAALDKIGGFPHVLLGEDTVVTAKLLQRGHKIAYVAEAIARHSHRYTLTQEFKRHFDTGLARKTYADLLASAGSDNKRGSMYAKKMLAQLMKNSPLLLPYGIMHLVAKWLGYQVGQKGVNFPLCIKRQLSSQDFYWK